MIASVMLARGKEKSDFYECLGFDAMSAAKRRGLFYNVNIFFFFLFFRMIVYY